MLSAIDPKIFYYKSNIKFKLFHNFPCIFPSTIHKAHEKLN